MIERCRLSDSFEIPNTAGEIHLEVDLRRRTVGVSMQVDPPGDKKRPTAAINWLTRQLKDDKIKNVLITFHWPRKTPATTKSLEHALEYPDDLVPENCKDLPTKLEIRRVVSLAGRFRGARTMLEDCEEQFVTFYRDIGQNVTPWMPPPPKYKKEQEVPEEDDLEASMDQIRSEMSERFS